MDRKSEQKDEEQIPMNDGETKKEDSTIFRVHRYFKEYCNSTSIHGMHYLAESRSLGERLLWFMLISCSLSACIYLILEIYGKFQRSPVIVSFATKESPSYTIPFPAVTICPLTKARKSEFNFTNAITKLEKNETLTDKEQRYAKYMSLVCEKELAYFDDPSFTSDFFEALDEIKIPLNEMMVHCKFMNLESSCNSLFYPIIVDHSICYTFNMLDRTFIYNENVVHFSNFHFMGSNSSEWTIDKGYDRTKKTSWEMDYPYRAFLAGADNALQVIFYQNFSNNDYLCIEDIQGFSVTVHAPYAVPLTKKLYFNVAFDRAVMAFIQPKVISTSEKVLHYSPEVRECYFSTEKKLKYFKIYSPRNCKLECYANFTLKECGCVGYYMPRVKGTVICGNGNYSCMELAEIKLKFDQLVRQIEEENEDFYCDCKPLCTDLSYDLEISASPWDHQQQIKVWEINDTDEHLAKLTLAFKYDSFLTSERNELYGPTDFLANFGGLLGLFTGFSLLSAAEIIYFLSVRMCCNFRLFGAWTGRDE